MPKEFSLADGQELIKLARKSIAYTSASGKRLSETTEKKRLLEKRGCFVTLNTFPNKELRGCIGFPSPVLSLWNAVIDGAVQAAFNDPRFSKLQANEIDKVLLEISILTLPEEISGGKSGLAEEIVIGEDGLIINKGGRSGLLLPQVAREHNWSAETFLDECCRKAGIIPGSWRQAGCSVFKFQAQIFSEKEPNGKIEES
jgi:AmmeMemoRadiSam system protein A